MNEIKYFKKFVVLNDYEMFNGYAYMYKSLNDFITHYKTFYKCKRDILIDNLKYWIVSQRGTGEQTILQLTFNDVFKHFITWFLYDLKIGKNDNITLIKYDDYIVIYTVNQKYEYYFNEF